ncbi:MAG: hypothetical protein JSV98_04200 [candidate division WOR-3 bacterium]|nr:MAG: hypothetical protein JSV98_04200 [candidate division WOR-3 bacterium]
MDKRDFSAEEALQYGWNTMKANIWFFVGVLVVAWALTGVPHIIANLLQEQSIGLSFLFRIIGWAANIIVSIGMTVIALKFLDNQDPRFEDLFSFKPYFWKYLGASILMVIIVWVGIILFVIPGVYWALKFQFFGYFVVEQGRDPVEAMRMSSRITQSVKWKLFGFGLVLALINIVGTICLFIGLLVTVPVTLLAFSFVYRKLLEQTESAQLGKSTPETAPVS